LFFSLLNSSYLSVCAQKKRESNLKNQEKSLEVDIISSDSDTAAVVGANHVLTRLLNSARNVVLN